MTFILPNQLKNQPKEIKKKFKPVIPYDYFDPISEMVKDINEKKFTRNNENTRYIYNYKSQPDGFIAKSQGNLFKSFSPVKVQNINNIFFDYL